VNRRAVVAWMVLSVTGVRLQPFLDEPTAKAYAALVGGTVKPLCYAERRTDL
jgi:hypothetical protein